MRILTEDKVTSLSGEDVSMYEATNTHGVELMRNDYPTSQWVSNMPVSLTSITDSSGNEIAKQAEVSFSLQGSPSFNGLYFGHFTCDAMNFTLFDRVTSSTWNAVGTPKEVPVIVDDSLYFMGDVIYNMDYMASMKALGYTNEQLDDDFKVEVNISTHKNQIEDGFSPHFQMENIKAVAYSDVVSTVTRKHWKITGYFRDSSGSALGISSDYFKQKLEVGMIFLLSFPSDNHSGSPVSRLAQINSIRGSGTESKSISMIIRSFEDDPSLTSFESYLSAQGTTVSGETDHIATSSVSYALRSIRIGILRAGYITELPNPQVGMSRNYKDYSIKKELVNGGYQNFNRNIARIYSGKLIVDRDTSKTLMNFVRKQRGKPFPVEILTDMEEEESSSLYGFFNSTPSENMSYRTGVLRDIDFSIQQVF